MLWASAKGQKWQHAIVGANARRPSRPALVAVRQKKRATKPARRRAADSLGGAARRRSGRGGRWRATAYHRLLEVWPANGKHEPTVEAALALAAVRAVEATEQMARNARRPEGQLTLIPHTPKSSLGNSVQRAGGVAALLAHRRKVARPVPRVL